MKPVQKPIAVLLSVLLLGLTGRGQTQEPHSPPPWVEQALAGPDRRDVAWEVHILPPRLLYQQRNLLEMRIRVDAAKLHPRPAELEFLIKVADAQGRWFPDDVNNRFRVGPEITKKQEIRFVTGIYLRPGKYTVAALLRENGTGLLNLQRKTVEIPPADHDPLPELDRGLPPVEFLSDVPHDSQDDSSSPVPLIPPWLRRRPFPAAAAAVGVHEDQTWPLGSGREWLPVGNPRPLRLDVVLDFSNTENRREAQDVAVAYRQNAGVLLQIGSLLSHLGVNGCVRVHGIEVLRMRSLFDADGRTSDWDKISRAVYGTNRATVDVGTLAARKKASAFFHDYLLKLFGDSGCGAGEPAAERAVVVVSRDIEFPSGTKIERLDGPGCRCRLFYLELPASATSDAVGTMLKPLDPRHLRIGSPRQFRQAVAQIIRELGVGN